MVAAFRLLLQSEPAHCQFERPWPGLVLDLVVVDGHSSIF